MGFVGGMRKLLPLAMCVLLGAVFAGSSRADDGCPDLCPGGHITVGLAGAFTGPFASFGAQLDVGVRVAVDEINGSGGLRGFKIQIIRRDDECKPDRASENALRYAQEKVSVVFGHSCAPASLAAARIYAEFNLLHVSPIDTTIQLTQQGYRNVFRVSPSDGQDLQFANSYLNGQPAKRVTIAHSQTAYGQFFGEQLPKLLTSKEVKVVPVSFAPGAAADAAEKIRESNPELVFVAAESRLSGELALGLRQTLPAMPFLSGGRALTVVFPEVAGPATEQAVALSALNSFSSDAYRRFAVLIAQTGAKFDQLAVQGYASVQMWSEAVKIAGSGETRRVADVLRSSQIPTAVGLVAFDERGERRNITYGRVGWRNGQLVELAR
jgi:branched-chain amino acid transport system substrate-binding protein